MDKRREGSMTNPNLTDEQLKKQQEFLDRARKGVLRQLSDQGGQMNLSALHDFSLNKYFIQHQGFSRMMEDCVNEGFVTFDENSQGFVISDLGRAYAVKQ